MRISRIVVLYGEGEPHLHITTTIVICADVCRAASFKAGGVGIRYTCMVCSRETYLFFEEDRWFIERRDCSE